MALVLSMLCLVLAPAVGHAQPEGDQAEALPSSPASRSVPDEDRFVLWLFEGSGAADDVSAAFRKGVREALAKESRNHLLGEQAFRSHVAARSGGVPACALGLEPCVSPHTLAFDALDLSLVIRLRLQSKSSTVEVSYEVVDRRGEVWKSSTVTAALARLAAFEVVREIFDATGAISFDSHPRGAAVEIDGAHMGQTPLSTRLGVGTYQYRLLLDDHHGIEGEVEIASASSRMVQHDLILLPGQLLVEGAPPGAILIVNGAERGPAAEALELEPGNYTLEIEADGFEPYRDTIHVTPGGHVSRVANLEPRTYLMKSIPPELIAARQFGVRAAYEHSFQATTFRNARTLVGDREFEFRGFTQDGVLPDTEVVRQFIHPNGLRLDAYYTGERFGLVLLSMSYLSTSAALPADVEIRQSGDQVRVDVTSIRRLQLRPFQLSYRFFYENMVPVVEAGTGISFQWIDIESDLLEQDVTLSQTEAFWTLGAGLQYHFTPAIFAVVRYGIQNYFNSGLGAEHLLTIGVGASFQNIFGFDAEPPGTL